MNFSENHQSNNILSSLNSALSCSSETTSYGLETANTTSNYEPGLHLIFDENLGREIVVSSQLSQENNNRQSLVFIDSAVQDSQTFREDDVIEKDHIIPKTLGGKYKDNIQLLHAHCHDEKTKDDLIAIKKHKLHKEYQKFMKQFNKMNWEWIEDIPTLVGTYKEPERREAV